MKQFYYEQYINTVPDFPSAGVRFRDFLPLFRSPEAFHHLISDFTNHARSAGAEIIVAPESRGFCLGPVVAYELKLPFIPIRKQGRLPGKNLIKVDFKTEYSEGAFEMYNDAIQPNKRVYILDDVIATGGTVKSIIKLINIQRGIVVGIGGVINLDYIPRVIDFSTYNTKYIINYTE